MVIFTLYNENTQKHDWIINENVLNAVSTGASIQLGSQFGSPATTSYDAHEIEPEFKLVHIETLPTKTLKKPIEVIIERDEDGFLAKTVNLPLFSYGDDFVEALENIKFQIESLYDELMEDDEFSEKWLRVKSYLKTLIG